jgi:hypothetical protein
MRIEVECARLCGPEAAETDKEEPDELAGLIYFTLAFHRPAGNIWPAQPQKWVLVHNTTGMEAPD